MRAVIGRAYAKVNLTLEVIGNRPDGYHELASIMQTVSLFDELSLTPAPDLALECNIVELATAGNLVLRAARLLGRGGHFELHKGIPVAGGMGGGSSDAALALRLLDAVYGLRLGPRALHDFAAELGSDVPFFLYAGTALVEGRGERVTPLRDATQRWLAVLNPGLPLATPAVYAELRPDEYASGSASRNWRPGRAGLPEPVNSLTGPALRLQPAIACGLQTLGQAGANRVMLSGSGPTVFGLCAGEGQARSMAQALGGLPARFVPRSEALRLDGA